MLKRYLRNRFNLSPDDYRAKWGLPKDYPMVAPAYAETRRSLAHSIGLGRKKDTTPKAKLSIAASKDRVAGETSVATKRGRPAKAKSEAETDVAETSEA